MVKMVHNSRVGSGTTPRDKTVRKFDTKIHVQSVEEGVSGPVGHSAASVSLSTFTIVVTLSTERSLVDLAILGTRERHAVVFQFNNGSWSFFAHVVDGILVTEPIGSLHGIVHVPAPVIWLHVAEGGVHSPLGSDSVRSGWKKLCDASGVETGFGQAKCGSKAGTASTDDDGIEFVVNDCVRLHIERTHDGREESMPN
jgi:hypothetical protein